MLMQNNSGEKVQPVFDFLNPRLETLQVNKVNKYLCIDEMMISSKSKFGPRVYQKGKPHLWGFKLFGISDPFGIVYKIHLHTDKFKKDDDFLDLGSTANRVFSLIKNVPRHQNYELYMDNYFLSIPLMNELRKVGIHSMGTIRIPNAAGFSDVCIPDDELSKLGDRVFAEYLCTGVDIEEPGIRLIR